MATGTFSVAFSVALPPAGTVSDDWSSTTECGEPAAFAVPVVNVIAEVPKLRTWIDFCLLKSPASSSKP